MAAAVELINVTKTFGRQTAVEDLLMAVPTVSAKVQLVLVDEPCTGLDPVNAVVLRDMILQLKRGGTTVIFSTHDMSTAERMCDFIFMIYRGKKVLDGTLASIQRQYGSDTLRVRLVSTNGDRFSLED